jgi:hypothetical protein
VADVVAVDLAGRLVRHLVEVVVFGPAFGLDAPAAVPAPKPPVRPVSGRSS